MRRFCACLIAATLLAATSRPTVSHAAGATFTRLGPLEAKIIAAAPAFPGGQYAAENVLRSGNELKEQEYASDGQGDKTFIDFDFGDAVSIAAVEHVQRGGPDTIAKSELVFSDSSDFANPGATVSVDHIDEPTARTFMSFPPVRARYVRWRVTSLAAGRSQNVGGRLLQFFTGQAADPAPQAIRIEADTLNIIARSGESQTQPLRVRLAYPYAEPVKARLLVPGQAPRELALAYGDHMQEFMIPRITSAGSLEIAVEAGGQRVASQSVAVAAARELTVYVLPHSHIDIGYTGIQTDIEEKQLNNLRQGLAIARRTADYPEGSRFVWNVEVAWNADLFLQKLPEAERAELLAAIRAGQVSVNGMYLNELTGLCRPEELTRLFRFATNLAEQTGVPIDAAMISDVPGYTWGTVTAMAQAGIRYFSVAPNFFDRIGTILVEWENKPFWWIGPDGQSKVLVWIPFRGYAMSFIYLGFNDRLVEELCESLHSRDYPYDIAYVRWSGFGDNAAPDAKLADFIRDWNAGHVSPRFVISSTSQAFRAFEERYGDSLPEARGDWSPYWEDGAGSSAAETALNRASSDRLAQAETLWAMLAPAHYPVEKFARAWNNVLFYSEHTWGAHCSVSQPASKFTADQWRIKQAYPLAANQQSRQLLGEAAQVGDGFADHAEQLIDVYNTSAWPRTEVVAIPVEFSGGARSVVDQEGRPTPSQRLRNSDLAILVRDLPPFSGRRFKLLGDEQPAAGAAAKVEGAVLSNDRLRVELDPQTGGIVALRAAGIDANLVDAADGQRINEYLYLIGDDVADMSRSGPARIQVYENGPLVTSVVVESEAEGCHQLVREVRLTAGQVAVELINKVDKRRLVADSYHSRQGKESLNFGFPFNVPQGEFRFEAPYSVIRPEQDQIASACKNWLTVGRWADVSNSDYGVTWVTLDAPLVQLGELSARLLNSQSDPRVWREAIAPTQKLYSWAMNNHWGTNYRAYQEGPVEFRYVLRPHQGPCDNAAASRLAIAWSQPLVVVPGRGAPPATSPLLEVGPEGVVATALKPSDDGEALILRLWCPGDEGGPATLAWRRPGPDRLWLSDTSERPIEAAGDEIVVPAGGVVTLRAEWSGAATEEASRPASRR